MRKSIRKKLYNVFVALVVLIYFACVAVLIYQALTPGNESSNISNNVGDQLDDLISSVHKPTAQKKPVSDVIINAYSVNGNNFEYSQSITLKAGDEGTLKCSAMPSDATNLALKYESSASHILDVQSDGSFSAISVGNAQIKVIADDNAEIYDTMQVSVEAIPTESINITNKIETLKIPQTHSCELEILPQNATYQQVSWISSDESVATVSPTGEICAISVGCATITVCLDGDEAIHDSFTVTIEEIKDTTVFAESVDIVFDNPEDQNKKFFIAKETVQLGATVKPDDVENKDVNWRSSSTSVATVSKNGLVSFLKGGTVTITATSSDGKAKDSVKFTVYDILPSSITLSSNSLDLTFNDGAYYTEIHQYSTAKITAKLSSDTTMKRAAFSSSNTNYIEVSSSGELKAKMQGKATITVSCSNKLGKTEVKLYVTVIKNDDFVKSEGITATVYSINGEDKRIIDKQITTKPGDTVEIIPTIHPTNSTSKTYSIKSSDTDVVQIDSSGLVLSLKPGTAVLTFTVSDEIREDGDPPPSLTIKITVTKIHVDSIEINSPPSTLVEDEQVEISVSVYPENATSLNLIWKSSNEDVLTVADGVITAVSAGSATITVCAADNQSIKATHTITVKAKTIPIERIVTSECSLTVFRKEIVTIEATIYPENATFKGVNWKSSDKTVATVTSAGVVTARKAGTAVITVSSNTYSDIYKSIEITVREIVSETIELTFKGIKIENGTAALKEAESATIKAKLDSTATVRKVNYTSSNQDVAKISDDGSIEALSPGKTLITIYTTDGYARTEISFTLIVNAVTLKDTMSNFYLWVRKSFGHFGAFLVLGIFAALSFILLSPKRLLSKIVSFILCIISGFAVAGITEICQLPVFTTGRCCAFSDVMLDFYGFCCSAITIFAILFVFYAIRALIKLLHNKLKKR